MNLTNLHKHLFLLYLFLFLFFLTACQVRVDDVQVDVDDVVEDVFDMKLSSVFKEGEKIPEKYTCKGDDVNPPLKISDIPLGTKSLVLIMDDPDAPMGTWDHWMMWNIPVINEIKEDSVPKGAVQGINSWKRNDYGGPCPPSGTHRYYFKLYALDTMLNLSESSNKKELERAMNGHIVAEAKLMGVFSK